MTRLLALKDRVILSAAGLPAQISQMTIEITYTPATVASGAISTICTSLADSCNAIAPLFAAQADNSTLTFHLPHIIADTTSCENGFLTLQNTGAFSPLDSVLSAAGPRGGEPEISIRPAGSGAGYLVSVQDWTDAPVFLAEYLRVIAGGQTEGIVLLAAGDGF